MKRFRDFYVIVPAVLALLLMQPVAFSQGVGQTSTGRTSGGGASTPTAGATVIGGTCASKILSTDGSNVLQCTTDLPGQVNISGPDAATNVEIGSTTNDANAGPVGLNVAIGDGASNTSGLGSNTVVGAQSGITLGGRVTIIGANSGCRGNDATCIGQGIFTNAAGVASTTLVGSGAFNSGPGTGVTAVGAGAGVSANQTSTDAIAVGRAALVGSGAGACARGIYIGAQSNCQGTPDSIGIGFGIGGQGAHHLAIGNTNADIDETYIGGSGEIDTTPTATLWSASKASGSNIAGGNLTLQPGRSTGTGSGGNLILSRVPTTQSSGSTLNSSTPAISVVSQAKTLTDATATNLIQVGGLGAHAQAGGQIMFSARASDGTDDQAASGIISWAARDTTAGAGGEAASEALVGTNVELGSSGTLTCTAPAATTGTDTVTIRISCDATVITPTTLEVFYTAITNCRACTITPQ